MRYSRIILLFFAFSLLVTGCVRDGDTPCPQGHYLYFETIMPKYVYEDVADRLEVFIYDENHEIVYNVLYSASELERTSYRVLVDKPLEGEHTVVTMVNFDPDYTSTTGDNSLRTLHSSILPQSGDTVKVVLRDNFQTVTPVSFQRVTTPTLPCDTLKLSKNNNRINLNISFGEHRLPAERTVISFLQGNNGEFDYMANKLAESCYRVYTPVNFTRSVDDEFGYSFSTNRLAANDDLVIDLRLADDNGYVYEEQTIRLSEELSKITDAYGYKLYDTDEKLEYEDEFELDVELDGNFQIVRLLINEWYVIRPGIDF